MAPIFGAGATGETPLAIKFVKVDAKVESKQTA